MKSWKDDPRSETNPVFGGNTLKIGAFGLNSGAQIMSLAPELRPADWALSDQVMAKQSALGLDIMVGIMNWQHKPELDPLLWAAALGARHPGPAVMSTQHIQLMHPVMAARMGATADLITGGRWGMNLVAGSNPATFAAFGREMQSHEDRYANAVEFVELLTRLWTAHEPITFDGRFFQCRDVIVAPQPVQAIPPLMNAGMSGRGRDFACKYADMVFTLLDPDLGAARTQIAEYRRIAREEFGRDVQIWTHGYFIIRDTMQEAEDFLNYYAVEKADRVGIDKWVKMNMASQSGVTDPAVVARLHRDWAAGSGTRLVGTADYVAEQLEKLSAMGLDGILMNSVEPLALLDRVGRDLLPRLEAAGLRKRPTVKDAPVHAAKFMADFPIGKIDLMKEATQ